MTSMLTRRTACTLIGAAAATSSHSQGSAQPYVTPQQFGAAGNGIMDDTKADQGALTKAASSGINLYFPPGAYVLSGPIEGDYAELD
jgi:polygalacturonase